jgi:hypothetical protein
MCADWLEENWPLFSQKAVDLIQRHVEEAFEMGGAALGADCDRLEWERVRKLWRET